MLHQKLKNASSGTTDITTLEITDITYEQDQNGVPNQAMSFDGVGDKLTLNNDISESGEFAISLWFNSNDVSAYTSLLQNSADNSNKYIAFFQDDLYIKNSGTFSNISNKNINIK